MRGRKPTPTALKIVRGNPGKRPLNEAEPQPTGTAQPPDWLSAEARAVWDHEAPRLIALGVLTDVDEGAFARYCHEWAIYLKVKDVALANPLHKTTRGNIIPNPALGIMHTAHKIILEIESEFGMTASSRSRVTVAKKESKVMRRQRA